MQMPPKAQRCDLVVVGFSDEDYAGVSLPHTDALIVSLTIANFQLRRIQEVRLIFYLNKLSII
jgi:hypothetical protein